MARSTVVSLRGEGGDGGGDDDRKATVKTIGDRDFSTLVKRCKSAQSSMNTEKATLGSIIADACENKHLHKGAFGIFRRLEAMDPYKRAELLFHLDIYRERGKWDTSVMFDREEEAAE